MPGPVQDILSNVRVDIARGGHCRRGVDEDRSLTSTWPCVVESNHGTIGTTYDQGVMFVKMKKRMKRVSIER